MSSCLGLYIEDNIIKYAKVSKEKDNLKVEALGVKFYDKIEEAIDQIVKETFSFKTPISINLSKETYNYFNMFALLNKQDLKKAIKTEFEAYCTDRNYNSNVFETRYAIVNNLHEKDKLKVIHISENKIELNKRIQEFEGYRLTNISPISMSISNIIDVQPKENVLVVNIEDKTTITTILDQNIYDINILEQGSQDILDKINLKENSYSKSYEICKNTTIYTSEGQDLIETETNYLEDIMPTLFDIVGGIRKTINENTERIDKVYITGTAALINNIDLYFQEYLTEVKCEIIKPYFINNTPDINIKDYIEVNSAISIALMGLGEGIEGMNFKAASFNDKIPSWLKIETNPNKTPREKKNLGGFLTFDLGQKLDSTERSLLRICAGLLILLIVYSIFSVILSNQMHKKNVEVSESKTYINSQISLAKKDSEKIKAKTNEYSTMIQNLQDINDRITEQNRSRNSIPNLLNQLMNSIPANYVQITSIENTTDRHMVIQVKTNKYEQLGFFIAKIKNDVILTNVVSTPGQKENNVISVRIEGDLP